MNEITTSPDQRVPHLLRLFTMARQLHRRLTPRQVAAEAGVRVAEVNAVLRGGPALVPAAAQVALARWNEVPLEALGGAAPASAEGPAGEGRAAA
ncbi:hypothetical protein [Pannonibacter tanglangensis]|uniref:XRE family transcriptional regulator n=1 Tax=Pannonibacter tanglangensis TaxID=2750084 RepID=A0ABW9ZE88_9HYPH|nr:hypothetical protein [Pannonibacter sp. XCT-34]NBN62806.1 hypothetical protein [Pannonibacter sp. XCT-34]